jgi:DnaJ family protein A protein 5
MVRRRCHYDILGVAKDVEATELKKVYRQMALKFHPDKNPDDQEGAHKAFQEIQQAYEVLSDPQERAWYDAHREAILQFGEVGGGQDVDVGGIDLFPYFSSSCFKGFGDDDEGFYAVYRHVFDTLEEEDAEFSDVELAYPNFGDVASEDGDWNEFYAFYTAYVTPRSYSWLDTYDTRQAENRRIVRLMEKDNKKVRDEARKERNELVRNLVKFMRKRDKRVDEYNKKLEEKTAENAKKTQEMRQRHLDERAKMLEEATQITSR